LYVYIRKRLLETERLENTFLFKRDILLFPKWKFLSQHFHGCNFGISWKIYTYYTKVLKKKF